MKIFITMLILFVSAVSIAQNKYDEAITFLLSNTNFLEISGYKDCSSVLVLDLDGQMSTAELRNNLSTTFIIRHQYDAIEANPSKFYNEKWLEEQPEALKEKIRCSNLMIRFKAKRNKMLIEYGCPQKEFFGNVLLKKMKGKFKILKMGKAVS